VCGQVFRYAVATGRVQRDPSADLRGALPPVREKHHAALTEPKQVGALLRAINGYQGSLVVRCAMRLAPLVFVRPGELRKAEWSEFDLNGATWRLPAGRMKMRTEHIVPLSRQAVEILTELKPLTGDGQYVFPSARTTSRPMSENAITAALRRMGYRRGEMTAHGFRTLASTLLNELGWSRDAIERQLAHAERDGVRDAYNRAEYLTERRRMMQAWADYLDGLTTDGTIIPLQASG
jgi:integrase